MPEPEPENVEIDATLETESDEYDDDYMFMTNSIIRNHRKRHLPKRKSLTYKVARASNFGIFSDR